MASKKDLYNSICSKCGMPAYLGLTKVECSNPPCVLYKPPPVPITDDEEEDSSKYRSRRRREVDDDDDLEEGIEEINRMMDEAASGSGTDFESDESDKSHPGYNIP